MRDLTEPPLMIQESGKTNVARQFATILPQLLRNNSSFYEINMLLVQ